MLLAEAVLGVLTQACPPQRARANRRTLPGGMGRAQAVDTHNGHREGCGASPDIDQWHRGEGRRMGSSTRIIRAVLLAAAAAALAFAAYQLREKHQEAEAVVQNIHDQLDALDPASRAAVVARLTSDEVKKVRGD
jgi:hypothetical protein